MLKLGSLKIKIFLNKLSPLEYIGIFSIITGILFYFINIYFTAVILTIFLIIAFSSPFISSYGFFLPIISKGNSGKNIIALTFDDGPDPFTTHKILKLLKKYNVEATFFVTGENALKYPNLIDEILINGHSIGNHSYSHDVFIMLKSEKKLKEEILTTQKILQKFNIVPIVFRPPVGITNPKLKKILQEMNMYCVTFNIRAFDGGNRNINNIANKILKKVKPDGIIILHDKLPKNKTLLPVFFKQLEILLVGLQIKKIKIAPLAKVIGIRSILTKQSIK